MTVTYANPANLGTLGNLVDVRFSARLAPGGLVSAHRDPDNSDLAIVAIRSHVRFRLALAECAAVARIVDIAAAEGTAAIELEGGQGLYLYRAHMTGTGRAFRLCIGSPLRKTIRESEVIALAAVLTLFSAYWDARRP